jgi:hypothetical protein
MGEAALRVGRAGPHDHVTELELLPLERGSLVRTACALRDRAELLEQHAEAWRQKGKRAVADGLMREALATRADLMLFESLRSRPAAACMEQAPETYEEQSGVRLLRFARAPIEQQLMRRSVALLGTCSPLTLRAMARGIVDGGEGCIVCGDDYGCDECDAREYLATLCCAVAITSEGGSCHDA